MNLFMRRWHSILVFMVISILPLIVLVAGTTSNVEGATPTRAPSTEWSDPFGDPSNTGYTSTTLPEEVTVSWKVVPFEFFSSQALVADETVVVVHTRVFAYDAQTGEEKWTYTANYGRSPPAMGGGRIFCGGSPFVALDLADGRELWSYDVFPIKAPTVSGDLVFVSELNDIYALSVLDGSLKWKKDGYEPSKVAVEDDVVYFTVGAGTDLGLYAVHKASGEQLWHSKVSYPKGFPPVLIDDAVFIQTKGSLGTSEGAIWGFSKSNGNNVFYHKINGSFDTPLVSTNGKLFFGTSDGVIHGIRITDGVEDFTMDTKTLGASGSSIDPDDWFTTGITLAMNGMVFVTDDDKIWVVGYDKTLKWSYDEINIFNSLDIDIDLVAVCNGFIYVAEPEGGQLWAFGPELPMAVVDILSSSPTAEESVTFDASGSTSPHGGITSYFFDFGDGTNTGWQSEPTASHTYTDAGDYTISIQVKDSADYRSSVGSTVVSVESNPTFGYSIMLLIIIIVVVILVVIFIMARWRGERESRAAKKAKKRLFMSLLQPSSSVQYQNTRILYHMTFQNRAAYPLSDINVKADHFRCRKSREVHINDTSVPVKGRDIRPPSERGMWGQESEGKVSLLRLRK